jgi:hypothetical protein
MGRLLGLGAVGAAGLTAAVLASSCGSTDVTCEDLATCPRSGQDGGGDETEASVDGQAGGGSDASDAAEVGDAGCTSTLPPSKSLCVNGDIALLVSSRASDGGTGTGKRGSEFKTIGAAIRAAQLGPKRIYICDDGVPYTEAIAIDAFTDPALDGISFYGGFDCADWTYSADKRARVTPPSGPALTLRKITSGVNLADLELVSADATASGTSSIAAIIDTAINVVFERVKITSGNGADGQAGGDGMRGDDGLAVASKQQGFAAMCPGGAPQMGGYWDTTGCGPLGSKGGSGGPATQGLSGGPGLAGVPGPDNSGPAGADGKNGADGAAGTPGVVSSAVGSYSSSGYTTAPPGGDGADGFVGQGGGGGGASNATGTLCIGASGGAGGIGGCGGKKGLGGASGGASIALLSWSSKLTIDHCDLIAGNGGGGGKGGNGGLAGSGKPGAEGGAAYTSDAGDTIAKGGHGGPGGNGGLGGSGAGGNGGPSYALVYKGDSPSKIMTTTTHGRGGTPGSGGMQVGGVKAADGTTPDPQNELQVN